MSLNRIMFKTLAMLAMANAMTTDKNIYSDQRSSNKGISFNPDYRRQSTPRELKEFTINGQKICAYSRKDAIKRLKHQKK